MINVSYQRGMVVFMVFPAREYDRLRTLQKKWHMSEDDMFYAIENGLIRVCVWLPSRYVECGVLQHQQFIHKAYGYREGFMGVRPQDCRLICSTGGAELRVFYPIIEEGTIIRLAYEPAQPAISVRLDDLVVLKKDREDFEGNYVVPANDMAELHQGKYQPAFIASEDYRYVKLDGREYHFGDVQARIVKLLHHAIQTNKPWVHSKTLIHESGSNAIRLRDLFKNKGHWGQLIISNKRGYYRLNIPLQEFVMAAMHMNVRGHNEVAL